MADPVLRAIPSSYLDTRAKLHLVAARVLAAARYQAVGRLGLEVLAGGFGTPEFDGRRLSVIDGTLRDGRRQHELRTLGDACEFAGVDLAAATHPVLQLPGEAATDVSIDVPAAQLLADWYALSQDVLAQFAAGCLPAAATSAITLWPEHFDVALEAGTETARAAYGGSPGDDYISEPYLYVGPSVTRVGDFWNAEFGAALTYTEVSNGADPAAFFATAVTLLG